MTQVVSVKTNFTSGQISAELFGRGDLSVYENGARCLENIIIHPTGGISRRKGLKFVDELSSEAKLISFEFNSEQEYIICLLDYNMKVYKDDICITSVETPWGLEHLSKINWTQSADTLLIVHPDVEPQKITRNNNEIWKIEPWSYYSNQGFVYCPYFNFYQNKINLTLSQSNGIVTISSDSDIFTEDYIGIKIKINGGLVKITSYKSAKEVEAKILKAVTNGKTDNWEEEAFSKNRGWPNSVTFHQDRLVIGGSKSLPNRVWFSKSSDLFNFDLGTGLDDEAIEFAILSDQVNAICHIVSSKHLLIFTTGSELMVGGDVITPTNIQLSRQTNIGSYNKFSISPEQINGAIVFVSYSGKQLREFLYTDVEQSYSNKDLSLLSESIINRPICSTFDKEANVLYVLLEDGSASCLTSYRSEEVNAWSKLKTNGKLVSASIVGNDMYFVVMRNNKYFLEKFDDNYFMDCSISLSSDDAKNIWNGLDYLEGMDVVVVSEGFYLGKYKVVDGKITLFDDVKQIDVGLPYDHIVEPLPYMLNTIKPFSPKASRIIDVVFRLIGTKSFFVNLGKGYFDVPLKRMFKNKILDAPPIVYSGDVELHSVRWVRGFDEAVWSIKSDVPLPFNLLSVVMKLEIKS